MWKMLLVIVDNTGFNYDFCLRMFLFTGFHPEVAKDYFASANYFPYKTINCLVYNISENS